MKLTRMSIILATLLPLAAWAESIFPLKISENRRYFVTQQGQPFLYNADTGWQIFTRLTTEEAVEYLTFRKNQGFNTVQVQIAMEPEQTNRFGQLPFHSDVDFSKPNEADHDHVVEVIAKAESMQLLIVMSQPWLGCCEEAFGNRPDKPIQKNGPAKNRQYGQYLGRKFAAAKNLFWIMGGDNDPKGDRESLFAFFEGLRATAPAHQLMTYHASPPQSSTDLFQYAPWLGFSFIYTYWPEKPNDWVAGKPQPHVYEAASRDWRDIMKYPGAFQMGHFIRFFEQIPWWTLQPDVRHEAVVAGYGDWSKNNFVTTAVSQDKRLLVSCLPELQSVTVNFGCLAGDTFTVSFFDPRTGQRVRTGTVAGKKVERIPSPPAEDLLLMIQGK